MKTRRARRKDEAMAVSESQHIAPQRPPLFRASACRAACSACSRHLVFGEEHGRHDGHELALRLVLVNGFRGGRHAQQLAAALEPKHNVAAVLCDQGQPARRHIVPQYVERVVRLDRAKKEECGGL